MFCDGSIFLDGAKWDIAFRRDESDRFSAVVLDSDCNLSGCHENKSTASDSISQNLLFAILLIPVTAWINLVSMLFVENAVAGIDQQMTGNTLALNLLMMAVLPAETEECMVQVGDIKRDITG